MCSSRIIHSTRLAVPPVKITASAIFPTSKRDRPLREQRTVPRPIPKTRRAKGPTVNTLIPEDPTSQRFEALIDALGNPALSGYESAVLAHLVSWSSADDVGALARLIKQARADSPIEGATNEDQG
jgi:hypothetical protein